MAYKRVPPQAGAENKTIPLLQECFKDPETVDRIPKGYLRLVSRGSSAEEAETEVPKVEKGTFILATFFKV
jgi:hypothetical protein